MTAIRAPLPPIVPRPPLRSTRVESNFDVDLREQTAIQLLHEGYKVPEASSNEDVVLKWVTVRLRHIPRRSRRTVWSEDLRRRMLDADTRRAVKRICAASEAGKNLNPHLSKRYLTASFNDLLHNDWGIHHMHLGPRSGRKTGRTGDLIFAVVTGETLYLLDVLDHGAFGDVRLVEIIYRNFPAVFPLVPIDVALPRSGETLSKECRVKAREGGVQSFVEIDGKLFASTGGITTSGDNRRAVTAMDDILDRIRSLEQRVHEAPEQAWSIFHRADASPAILKLKLLLGGTLLSLSELTVGAHAELGEISFGV